MYAFKSFCSYEIVLPQAFCKLIIISPVQKKLRKLEEFIQILRAN